MIMKHPHRYIMICLTFVSLAFFVGTISMYVDGRLANRSRRAWLMYGMAAAVDQYQRKYNGQSPDSLRSLVFGVPEHFDGGLIEKDRLNTNILDRIEYRTAFITSDKESHAWLFVLFVHRGSPFGKDFVVSMSDLESVIWRTPREAERYFGADIISQSHHPKNRALH